MTSSGTTPVRPSGTTALRSPGGTVSIQLHRRSVAVGGALVLVLLALSVVAIALGTVPVPLDQVLAVLTGRDVPGGAGFIVLHLRLPRLLTGILIGLALGMAGAISQSLARNPLGSPDVIGFTSGAATGAVLAILVFGGGAATIAAGAVGGGAVTAVVIALLAYSRGSQGISGYRLVLVGVGIAAALTAINGYLIVTADLDEAHRTSIWLVGTLNDRGWGHAMAMAAAMLVLVPLVLAVAPVVPRLELGDDTATALGVRVGPTRLLLLALVVALTAASTATAGPIAFVALAAPQLARRLTRAPGIGVLTAGLMGAVVLVASDLIAQRVFSPEQLPVGVTTSAVGGLYLAWLLSRR